jgi:protein involved in polysaccharide export with SLBB domain
MNLASWTLVLAVMRRFARGAALSSLPCFLGVAGLFALPVTGRGAEEQAPSYALAPNDLLEIRVFQEDDLASRLRISPSGTINFPLIGVVTVGGLSPQEAAAAIRAKLAKDYLVNPQVTVTVFEYGKRRFAVLGEVQKAGTFDMPEREKVTLLDAIAMAGGYTRIADPSKVTLKRKDGGKETIIRLNAKTMAKDVRTGSFVVLPGDVITVGESLF